MKFDAGPSYIERWRAREQWHRWFAWHPVRVGKQRVWLEMVERQGHHFEDSMGGGWSYDYRLPPT